MLLGMQTIWVERKLTIDFESKGTITGASNMKEMKTLGLQFKVKG